MKNTQDNTVVTPRPIRRERLVDQVVNSLRVWLAEAYSPGDRLPPELKLMKHFQVGRSTIREAVGVLAYLGILQVRAGDGTYFKGFSEGMRPLADLLNEGEAAEVFEVRRAFEMAIARLAAEKRTATDLRNLQRALEAGKASIKSGKLANFLQADLDFHSALGVATHNTMLVRLYTVFRENLLEDFSGFVEREEFRRNLIKIHECLYQAIKKRSSLEAQLVWENTPNPFS